MARQDDESPMLVTMTALTAVAGVVTMKVGLGLDQAQWALAYVATALTASIRRTSLGTSVSQMSAARGMACLLVGLWVCSWLGHPVDPGRTAKWVPDEFILALSRLHR